MDIKPRFGRVLALLPFLLLFALAGFAESQGLSKTLYKDRVNGFKFRPPSKYDTVPARNDLQTLGILSWMDSQVEESGGIVIVLRLDDALGREGGPYKAKRSKKSKKGRSRVRSRRPALTDFLSVAFGGLFRSKTPMEERAFKMKGVQGLHRKWRMGLSILDAYTYKGPQADIHLLYFVDQAFVDSKSGKKWPRMHVKSGRSFERMSAAKDVDLSTLSYEALVRYHKVLDAQYKDWRVMPTPSKKYIVKTSSKRGAFIKNAITRLDRSRRQFEKDFPADFFGRKMTAVSVVRICSTAEEFHKYGGTDPGVAGWFNPSSEELVLYSGEKDKERDALTYGVMSHEAFHQYCHFLFDRAEAHRWFDEGHGDYYAAAAWFKGKVYLKPEAASKSINRLPMAQELARGGGMVPLEEHLNFTHSEWQLQGLRSYAQSWSIVYMLRQGALGKLPKRFWKREYANIIPSYMQALLKGYENEYALILEERRKAAAEDKRELTPAELTVSRLDIDALSRETIWEDAMEASWGAIDLDEFEERWIDYVSSGI